MAQSVKAARQGLLAACQSIYANATGLDGSPVLVTLGPSGTYAPSACVNVAATSRQQTPRLAMGGSRDKTVDFDVVINVWSGGTEAVQQQCIEAVDDLSELLEAYFQTPANGQLGGGSESAWVSSVDGPTASISTDLDGNATGRQAESIVVVTVRLFQ